MTKLSRFALPLIAASLGACVGLSMLSERVAMATEPKTVTVTVPEKDKDYETTVKLSKGESLVLKLVEQPGTAYGWKIVKNNATVLKAEGKPEREKPVRPLPGGKVNVVYRFTVEAAGSSDLEMHYVRPFDKDKPPAKILKLAVKAE